MTNLQKKIGLRNSYHTLQICKVFLLIVLVCEWLTYIGLNNSYQTASKVFLLSVFVCEWQIYIGVKNSNHTLQICKVFLLNVFVCE